jgi:HNH endonuclease
MKRSSTAHPILGQDFSETFDERFWAKVDKNGPVPAHRPELGPCWIWTAGLGNGYGKILARKQNGKGRFIDAHRASYLLNIGPIPDGELVCHKCDNKRCVRPDHLFPGTYGDNFRDCIAKGRGNQGRPGEQNSHAVLTAEDVIRIRELRAAGWNLKQLAAEFPVTVSAISRAYLGKSWKHLPDLLPCQT